MSRPALGLGVMPKRTPRTMDEAFGWRAPLDVPKPRRRPDLDQIIGVIAVGLTAGWLALTIAERM